ncbi:hypothetical protein [Hymenobacter antarcticus]|uniref:Uncharacterized protein n=1 Tax=Hymenobacter antarcticus TaxID=486270 RepID=A0ABP7QE71_9BACT
MLTDREADADVEKSVSVWLDDFGLLCFQHVYEAMPFGGRHQDSRERFLYDLTTGRALTIASQLRPGYATPLRRLLAAHLLHYDDFDSVNRDKENEWGWRDVKENPSRLPPLPALNENSTDDLVLTVAGLEATYSPFSLFTIPGGMSSSYPVLIPYRELRPLVQPGTALARMGAARGL